MPNLSSDLSGFPDSGSPVLRDQWGAVTLPWSVTALGPVTVQGSGTGSNNITVNDPTQALVRVQLSGVHRGTIGSSPNAHGVFATSLADAFVIMCQASKFIQFMENSNGSIGTLGYNQGLALTNGGVVVGADCSLIRSAAAVWQQGAANAASPVAQTLQAQGSRSGTDSNVGGANYTHSSGQGTGTGTLSSLIFQTPVAVASGTGAQTMTTALTLNNTNATFAGSLTTAGFFALTAAHVSGTGIASFTGSSNLGYVTIDTTTATAGGGVALRQKYGGTTIIDWGYDKDAAAAIVTSGVATSFRVTLASTERFRCDSQNIYINPGAALDTGLWRNAAGVAEINSGTAGTYRDLKLRNLIAGGGNGSYIGLPAMTVANLPAAGTKGRTAFVTDATNTVILGLGLTAVGGGSNNVPVYDDGTNWIIG